MTWRDIPTAAPLYLVSRRTLWRSTNLILLRFYKQGLIQLLLLSLPLSEWRRLRCSLISAICFSIWAIPAKLLMTADWLWQGVLNTGHGQFHFAARSAVPKKRRRMGSTGRQAKVRRANFTLMWPPSVVIQWSRDSFHKIRTQCLPALMPPTAIHLRPRRRKAWFDSRPRRYQVN